VKVDLYTTLCKGMRRIRTVEETIAARYSEQEMRCPTHLSSGQEAVSASVGAVLRSNDLAVSGHRAHAHYLAKGGNLNAMIAEIYGRVTGCSRGKGGSMHLIDETAGFMGSTAIVGGTVPVGVGLGYSLLMNGNDRICCIFIGDSVVETGVFYESLNFAILKNLPILFVCENNFYSVYSPLSVRQSTVIPIHQRVSGLGIRTHHGDGNDVLRAHTIVSEAVTHIRSGRGPVFLEFETFRWREHCGPNFDDELDYRPDNLREEWRDRDPISLFEVGAISEGHLTTENIEAIQVEIDFEVKAAFEFARNSAFPSFEEAALHVFATTMKDAVG
jgi:TPP-dependent pyruvate/acetoin dehydrogenase alpha subunit